MWYREIFQSCWLHRLCIGRRLAGPALSIAKALARAAPWDGILASVCVMPGQLELEHLWQRAEPLRVSPGETLDTYLLPVQAAPAYAQHPSAPQSKTRGAFLALVIWYCALPKP